MAQTSSVNTLAATTGMSAATSLVEWLANSKMHLAMPPEVVLTIAAGLVTISHFLANVINSALTEDGLPTLAQFVPTTVTKQTGFARLSMLFGLIAVATACLALSGCGTVDAWVAGKTNIVEQDYKGARANVKRQDDDVLQLWLDTSCDVKVGALARNPEALTPVMAACPVSGMAKVNTANGNISLSVPNTLPFVQSQPATPAAADTTQQTMKSILTTLQTIQTQTAPAPVTKAQPVKKTTPAAPVVKPSASAAPVTVTSTVATPSMPVVIPAPASAAKQPATPAETQMRSFLSAPRTTPSN